MRARPSGRATTTSRCGRMEAQRAAALMALSDAFVGARDPRGRSALRARGAGARFFERRFGFAASAGPSCLRPRRARRARAGAAGGPAHRPSSSAPFATSWPSGSRATRRSTSRRRGSRSRRGRARRAARGARAKGPSRPRPRPRAGSRRARGAGGGRRERRGRGPAAARARTAPSTDEQAGTFYLAGELALARGDGDAAKVALLAMLDAAPPARDGYDARVAWPSPSCAGRTPPRPRRTCGAPSTSIPRASSRTRCWPSSWARRDATPTAPPSSRPS